MHVVVFSSRVVFHHCIISFVIVCFGFVVVPGVSLHVSFLRAPCLFCIRCTSFLFLWFVILFVFVSRRRWPWALGSYFLFNAQQTEIFRKDGPLYGRGSLI